MNHRSSAAVAAAALAAAGGAVAVWLATGEVPAALVGGECFVALAQGPCEAAQALSENGIDCESGTLTTQYVEIVAAPEAEGGGGAALPAGFDGVPGTARDVLCASLSRGGLALTVVPMSKHGRPSGGVTCPEVVIAGHEPPGCGAPVEVP